MNGELAQAVALTAHARAALAGAPFELDLGSSTFQFVGELAFEGEVRRLLRATRHETIGATPRAWFDHLVRSGCRSLGLVLGAHAGPLPAHVAVAFAGGGSWGIVAEREDGRSVWTAHWRVADLNAADRRIWSVVYRESGRTAPLAERVETDAASVALASVLADADAFAGGAGLETWRDGFRAAREKLDADPVTFQYHGDLLPSVGYGRQARRLLSACEHAWVFGGMGSWNDLGFRDADLQGRYETITRTLYTAVLSGIVVATNARFEGPER